jgi:hypothetical protein
MRHKRYSHVGKLVVHALETEGLESLVDVLVLAEVLDGALEEVLKAG